MIKVVVLILQMRNLENQEQNDLLKVTWPGCNGKESRVSFSQSFSIIPHGLIITDGE